MTILNDLIRRANESNLFVGNLGRGPCVTTNIDSEGIDSLKAIQKELGGHIFISGEDGRYSHLPTIWTIHRDDAIVVMKQLIPLLKQAKSLVRLCAARNTIAEWRRLKVG